MAEPATIVLTSSGLVGFLIRYARRRYREAKNYFDVFLGTVGLLLSAPIIAFLGLLVKLTSPGPVFYVQERVGKEGKPFRLIKLRTMRADAEAQTGPVWAGANDPRVTTLGRVMRKLHLDELPQFFNVVMGDMSIVGPRPERPFFVEKLRATIPGYELRLSIKPGITGLAQVRYHEDHSVEDVRRKLVYDLLYVEKMCWWLDLRIIGWTALKLLNSVVGSSSLFEKGETNMKKGLRLAILPILIGCLLLAFPTGARATLMSNTAIDNGAGLGVGFSDFAVAPIVPLLTSYFDFDPLTPVGDGSVMSRVYLGTGPLAPTPLVTYLVYVYQINHFGTSSESFVNSMGFTWANEDPRGFDFDPVTAGVQNSFFIGTAPLSPPPAGFAGGSESPRYVDWSDGPQPGLIDGWLQVDFADVVHRIPKGASSYVIGLISTRTPGIVTADMRDTGTTIASPGVYTPTEAQFPPIPEPASMLLLGMGLVGMASRRGMYMKRLSLFVLAVVCVLGLSVPGYAFPLSNTLVDNGGIGPPTSLSDLIGASATGGPLVSPFNFGAFGGATSPDGTVVSDVYSGGPLNPGTLVWLYQINHVEDSDVATIAGMSLDFNVMPVPVGPAIDSFYVTPTFGGPLPPEFVGGADEPDPAVGGADWTPITLSFSFGVPNPSSGSTGPGIPAGFSSYILGVITPIVPIATVTANMGAVGPTFLDPTVYAPLIPEPATMLLLGAGLGGLRLWRRKERKVQG